MNNGYLSFFQVCHDWLNYSKNDTEIEGDQMKSGESYLSMVSDYLRRLVLATQVKNSHFRDGGGFDQLELDLLFPFSFTGWSTGRSKRQVQSADGEVTGLLTRLGPKVKEVVDERAANGSFSELVPIVEDARNLYEELLADHGLTLEHMHNFSEVIHSRMTNESISIGDTIALSHNILEIVRLLTSRMVHALGMTEDDLDVSVADFCIVFHDQCDAGTRSHTPSFPPLGTPASSIFASATPRADDDGNGSGDGNIDDISIKTVLELAENHTDIADSTSGVIGRAAAGNSNLPMEIKCRGLSRDKRAAEFFRPADFGNWTRDELEACIEVIGAIDWTVETKQEIWEVLKAAEVRVNIGKPFAPFQPFSISTVSGPLHRCPPLPPRPRPQPPDASRSHRRSRADRLQAGDHRPHQVCIRLRDRLLGGHGPLPLSL